MKSYSFGLLHVEYSRFNFGLGFNIDTWKEPALSIEINLSIIGSIQIYLGKNKNGNEY